MQPRKGKELPLRYLRRHWVLGQSILGELGDIRSLWYCHTGDLLELFMVSRLFEATDPRDKVYSVLGLAQTPITNGPDKVPPLDPDASTNTATSCTMRIDYSATVSEVCQYTAKYLINRDRNLDTLCILSTHQDHGSADLLTVGCSHETTSTGWTRIPGEVGGWFLSQPYWRFAPFGRLASAALNAGFGGNDALEFDKFSRTLYNTQYHRVGFPESHDEAGNAGGTARTIVVAVGHAPVYGPTRTVAEARCCLCYGLSLLSAATPMFFMGEEVGAQKPYKFDNFVHYREDITGLRDGIGGFMFRFY